MICRLCGGERKNDAYGTLCEDCYCNGLPSARGGREQQPSGQYRSKGGEGGSGRIQVVRTHNLSRTGRGEE